MRAIYILLAVVCLSGCAHTQRYDANGNPIPSRTARFFQGFSQGYNQSLAAARASQPKVLTCTKTYGLNQMTCQ